MSDILGNRWWSRGILLLRTSSRSRFEGSRGRPGIPGKAIGRSEACRRCWTQRPGSHEALLFGNQTSSAGACWTRGLWGFLGGVCVVGSRGT